MNINDYEIFFIQKNRFNDFDLIKNLIKTYELYINTDENRKLMKDILNIEKSFYDSLTDNQKKQFEDLMDLKGLNVGVTDGRIFTFAFSLVVRLILESKI